MAHESVISQCRRACEPSHAWTCTARNKEHDLRFRVLCKSEHKRRTSPVGDAFLVFSPRLHGRTQPSVWLLVIDDIIDEDLDAVPQTVELTWFQLHRAIVRAALLAAQERGKWDSPIEPVWRQLRECTVIRFAARPH
jgi:hypothetical protein